MNWYYGIHDKQYGPVDFTALLQMAREGRLNPEDLVWNQTMGETWVAARNIPELNFGEMTPSPVAPAPVTEGTVDRIQEPVAVQPTPMGYIENKELMSRARNSLKGQWGVGIAACLLYLLFTQLPSSIILFFGAIATLIITGPLMVGLSRIFLNLSRSRVAEIGQLFEGFQCFGSALGAYFLSTLFIFLWSLLLIVPGIIAIYSYSMIYFILSDHPEISSSDAITLSKEMMRGYKWQYFCLGLRFLGWILLSLLLTLGIGMLWVMPYMQTSYAHFYQMVRSNYRPDVV